MGFYSDRQKELPNFWYFGITIVFQIANYNHFSKEKLLLRVVVVYKQEKLFLVIIFPGAIHFPVTLVVNIRDYTMSGLFTFVPGT